jgi:hypothetical protein
VKPPRFSSLVNHTARRRTPERRGTRTPRRRRTGTGEQSSPACSPTTRWIARASRTNTTTGAANTIQRKRSRDRRRPQGALDGVVEGGPVTTPAVVRARKMPTITTKATAATTAPRTTSALYGGVPAAALVSAGFVVVHPSPRVRRRRKGGPSCRSNRGDRRDVKRRIRAQVVMTAVSMA